MARKDRKPTDDSTTTLADSLPPDTTPEIAEEMLPVEELLGPAAVPIVAPGEIEVGQPVYQMGDCEILTPAADDRIHQLAAEQWVIQLPLLATQPGPGYSSYRVDAKLSGPEIAKFRRLQDALQRDGAMLRVGDGARVVGSPADVLRWLIQQIPD